MRYHLLLLPLIVAACATSESGRRGITIETAGNHQTLAGASCAVSNLGGSWTVTTPAVVDVGDVNGDLHVVCNKSGYRTSEFVFRPAQGSGSSVGLGLGGGGSNVGVGFGFRIPIGGRRSGAYPPSIIVEMTPL